MTQTDLRLEEEDTIQMHHLQDKDMTPTIPHLEDKDMTPMLHLLEDKGTIQMRHHLEGEMTQMNLHPEGETTQTPMLRLQGEVSSVRRIQMRHLQGREPRVMILTCLRLGKEAQTQMLLLLV